MLEQAVPDLGGVARLINNAGFQIPGDSHEIDVAMLCKLTIPQNPL
ncbi:MAG: hypothetical protein HC837_20130 [Chloroflexaceae bacterium]|nr:hypothetical protein [Chloroflexaceae bacterium]